MLSLERDRVVFDNLSQEEFDSIYQFIKRYNNHLDDEIKKMNYSIK